MILAGLLGFAARADASFLDPALRFREIRTPHFVIAFHQEEEPLARRLALVAEDVWQKVGGALGIQAPRRTYVIVADQTELANGWATPIPYNTIFVTAAAPPGYEFIGRTEDWPRLVFTHEFAHIVHLDRSEGWARIFRGLFGRTPIAFPNLWLPGWQIEGLATWQESRLTGQGRRSAADFRAIEREAGRAGRVEPIDRVNGGLTDWPSGFGQYAYGLGFHEYLAERFGEERFGELLRASARKAPFFGTLAFEDVFGEDLGDLWSAYAARLAATPVAAAPPVQPVQLTHDGFTALAPRFAPPRCDQCETEILYAVRNPRAFPSLNATTPAGGASRRLTRRYLGSTTAATKTSVVYDEQEFRRVRGLYSDLRLLDRRTGRSRTLTRESRLQDPDLAPDGLRIAAVREHRGQRDLVVVHLTVSLHEADAVRRTRVARIEPLLAETETQFSAPRWSPDGRQIAVERRRLGANAAVVLVDVGRADARTLAADPNARFVTPAWRPDGRSIVLAADLDGDTFNLYEVSTVESEAFAPRRLTYTTGGALWPDVSPDGRSLVFAGYTSRGYDIFTVPYPETLPAAATRPRSETPARAATAPRDPSPDHTYRPWATLLPRSWWPLLESTADYARVGGMVSGSDVLGRHQYSATATWLTTLSESLARPSTAAPDWLAAYSYTRWVPTLFASASRDTIFAAGIPDADGRPTNATVVEQEVEAGFFVPRRRARTLYQAIASVAHVSDRFVAPTDVESPSRTSLRTGVSASSVQQFGYSISPERGMRVGATLETSRRAEIGFGDTAVWTADARAYLPGFAAHHVLALRAGGGASTAAAPGLARTFRLGGGLPNLQVIDFGRDAFSLLRGFPINTFAGSHAALVNVDYRFPVARPQRGIHVAPFFVNTIHAAVFGDAGHAWSPPARTFRWRDGKLSAGGEVAANIVIGYSFPVTLAAGGGVGYDAAQDRRQSAAYLRIGYAF